MSESPGCSIKLQIPDTPVCGPAFGHAGVVELWRSSDLCDMEVVVEGKTFHVHRLILAGCSPYFFTRFKQPNFSDNDPATPFVLNEMSAAAFSCVLEFIYLGVCELADDTLLVPVLEAAAILQIQTLLDISANAIAERVSIHSCVGAWALAERHELSSLAAAAEAQTLKCFGELPLEAIVVINHQQLCSLLADDRLAVQSEESLFVAVESWYAAQSPTPAADKTTELVQRIRFPFMSQEFVNDKVLNSPMLQTLPASKALGKVLMADKSTPAKHRHPVRVDKADEEPSTTIEWRCVVNDSSTMYWNYTQTL